MKKQRITRLPLIGEYRESRILRFLIALLIPSLTFENGHRFSAASLNANLAKFSVVGKADTLLTASKAVRIEVSNLI